MTAWDVITAIPSRAPLWVWPLLAWMIWDGMRAMRDRIVGIWFFWMLPFFALIALRGRVESPAPELDLPIYFTAYLAGAAFGHWYQGRVIVERTAKQVTVRGEPLTLIMLMTIFWMNFARGVIEAISPDLTQNPAMIALLAVISGAASGR